MATDRSSMQNSQHPQHRQRTFATIAGWLVGGLGFLLSFALAVTMLVRGGNPGFLLIWLAAAISTLACMRVHARWRKSFERMYSPEAVPALFPARKGWRQNVEDVTFRDLPDASMSFSQ
jgi:FtsH-binding integral membrane protein